MVSYFDTSFILAFLFGEIHESEFLKYYNASEYKISSILLDIEMYLNINKFIDRNNLSSPAQDTLISTYLKILDSINLLNINKDIIHHIKNNTAFTETKSLDAIHLATAFEISTNIGGELILLSYDKNMNKIGKKIGFNVIE